MEKRALEKILKDRFEEHMDRHPGLSWDAVAGRIKDKDWEILEAMEAAGGEPDVLVKRDGGLFFGDCCKETPKTRRSLCYDEPARLARKQNAPDRSAWGMAEEIGAVLMDEEAYRVLQAGGPCDEKGQVWLATEEDFRKKGDALFANLRHGRVFVYYNGAGSYYRNRGFRCMLDLA